jgi:hypothetical protein
LGQTRVFGDLKAETIFFGFCRYYGDNVWPGKDEPGVEGFEEAFKEYVHGDCVIQWISMTDLLDLCQTDNLYFALIIIPTF